MEWLHKVLLQLAVYRRIVNACRRIQVIGMQEVTYYDLLADFFEEIHKESIITKASALAYRFLLATFPAVIFIFTLIPFIPISNFQISLLNTFRQILPGNVFSAAETTLQEIVIKPNGGLLSAGFLASVFFSTNGVSSLIMYLNKSNLNLKKTTYLKRRYTALLLTLLLTILLLSSAVIGIAGQFAVAYLYKRHFIRGLLSKYALVFLQWIIVTLLFYFAISSLYYYGPSRKQKAEFFTPGGAVAAFLCILTTFGFARYVQDFGNYNRVYGSIGTLIVIMILLYLNSAILLISYDLDIAIEKCRVRSAINHLKSAQTGRSKNVLKT